MPSGDGFDGVRQMSQAISQGIAEHVNAPPLRKNQNRAVWGTGLLTGGIYAANSYVVVHHGSIGAAAQNYIRALHEPFGDSWLYYGWGALTLFGLLWVVVGLRGSRGPRDIMAAFWALAWVAGSGAALWYGWYPDDHPALNWFLKGIYLMVFASSVMALFVAVRGPGSGAVRLVQQQIARQARIFRLGRRRSF